MKIFKKKREDEPEQVVYSKTASGASGENEGKSELESEPTETENIADANKMEAGASEDAIDGDSGEAGSKTLKEPEDQDSDKAGDDSDKADDDSKVADEEEPEPEWVCPAGMEKAFAFLTDSGWPAGKEKPSAELLEVVERGLKFEESVRQAAAEGEVRGRNVRIHECFMTPDSDGVPHLGSQGSLRGARVRATSIFDVARSASS